jgi:hypothetical protein
MADPKKLVPGTWFVAVTRPDGSVVHTIMTFTSDEGMVERAEPELEAAIGVWKPGDRKDEFRFMFYRFAEKLTITEPQEEEKGEKEELEAVNVTFDVIQRLRSTNHFTSDDGFEGTGTLDFLDAEGTPTAIPAAHTKHKALRLQLVQE